MERSIKEINVEIKSDMLQSIVAEQVNIAFFFDEVE